MSTTEITEDGQTVSTSPEAAVAEAKAKPAKPKAVKKDKTVEVGGDETGEVAVVVARNHDSELSGKKVRVTFFEQDHDGGADAIFASLNGFAYQIPRGVPVDIPVEVLAIFENAKTDIISTAPNGGTNKRTINRFSYTVHGYL